MPLEQVNFGAHKAAPRDANRRGHGTEGATSMQDESIPYGTCHCGCGRKTRLASRTEKPRALNSSGYGAVTIKRKSIPAHRWYYEQTNGPIPDELVIDHLCRNPRCVNPAHLEAVTNAENTRRGNKTILTVADVRAIRDSPLSNAKVARLFGVSTSAVNGIRRGVRWGDVQ